MWESSFAVVYMLGAVRHVMVLILVIPLVSSLAFTLLCAHVPHRLTVVHMPTCTCTAHIHVHTCTLTSCALGDCALIKST